MHRFVNLRRISRKRELFRVSIKMVEAVGFFINFFSSSVLNNVHREVILVELTQAVFPYAYSASFANPPNNSHCSAHLNAAALSTDPLRREQCRKQCSVQ